MKMKRCQRPKQCNQCKKLEAYKDRGVFTKKRGGRGLQGESIRVILEEVTKELEVGKTSYRH